MSSEARWDGPSATLPDPTIERLRARLKRLYGPQADPCLADLLRVAGRYARQVRRAAARRWDQRDVVLITYGDQVQQPAGPALPALERFLTLTGLTDLINTVHILPFSPYSSDDGFAVIDYRQVNPAVGSWEDVRRLGQHVGLMFDLVLNHCSRQSAWFEAYRAGRAPFDRYFIEVDPAADLSRVTRPRSSPLLTPVPTCRGTRHVWTTFSEDQVDLNFAEPAVLVEFVDILLFYAAQGARIIRLDAIAYLWKEIGTDCIHRPQTHEVVKLMRDLLDAVAPQTLLITETNVPHEENVRYFGAGDEAHMVYQFSLPPLLLDALLNEDALPLRRWLARLEATPPGTTFLNFTASHDGVGVRPLEGLVSRERVARLVAAAEQRGGLVSTGRSPDGAERPYELNITYFDALGEPAGMAPRLHVRRFLASQALMLSLPGIPAIYFHSLVGTRNDLDAVRRTGQPRRINRRKFQLDELMRAVQAAGSIPSMVFDGYRRLLKARIAQPAFHPEAPCEVYPIDRPALLAFLRTSPDRSQRVMVVANFSARRQPLRWAALGDMRFRRDLRAETELPMDDVVAVEPFQVMWLEEASSS